MSSEFVAHTFENADFSSPIRFVWSHIRRHPGFALAMVFGAFSNAALASVVPMFTGYAVDAIINHRDLAYVGVMALAILGSQMVRGLFRSCGISRRKCSRSASSATCAMNCTPV